jgi:altronate dehydratase large subunit
MGYLREDGQVGIRNHIIAMSTVSCINPVTERIARMTDIVPITHGYGCGQGKEDSSEIEWCLTKYAENPNVAAILVVGLGCEQIDAERVAGEIKGKPTNFINVAKGGEKEAIEKGLNMVQEMKLYASSLKRVESTLSKLIIPLTCGGSDTTSGIASNPALGVASEMLSKEGGKVILDEATFAEHFLLKNIADRKVIEELWRETDEEAEYYKKFPTVRGINPTPGNIRKGLTTLTEKRLGGVLKGGNTPFKGIISYRDKPVEAGLYWWKDKNYIGYGDIIYCTMTLLPGSQINCFTTGYGTPLGTAIAPVIKITANPETYERNKESMDINASTILYGEESIKEVGNRIFNEIIEVANGKLTKSEIMDHRNFLLPLFTISGKT